MERLTNTGNAHADANRDYYAVYDRLASYEDALTLPDGTVMGPSEVAALRARREAAEADLESVADGATICGVCDQTWCSACDGYNQFKWRGPQEGATAHERV